MSKVINCLSDNELTETNLSPLSFASLRKECKSRLLDDQGDKHQLKQRLIQYKQSKTHDHNKGGLVDFTPYFCIIDYTQIYNTIFSQLGPDILTLLPKTIRYLHHITTSLAKYIGIRTETTLDELCNLIYSQFPDGLSKYAVSDAKVAKSMRLIYRPVTNCNVKEEIQYAIAAVLDYITMRILELSIYEGEARYLQMINYIVPSIMGTAIAGNIDLKELIFDRMNLTFPYSDVIPSFMKCKSKVEKSLNECNAWFNDPNKTKLVIDAFNQGKLLAGDPFYFRKYHIRPVQFLGVKLDLYGKKVEQQEWNYHDFRGYQWARFDIIDREGNEWNLAMELRFPHEFHGVEAFAQIHDCNRGIIIGCISDLDDDEGTGKHKVEVFENICNLDKYKHWRLFNNNNNTNNSNNSIDMKDEFRRDNARLGWITRFMHESGRVKKIDKTNNLVVNHVTKKYSNASKKTKKVKVAKGHKPIKGIIPNATYSSNDMGDDYNNDFSVANDNNNDNNYNNTIEEDFKQIDTESNVCDALLEFEKILAIAAKLCYATRFDYENNALLFNDNYPIKLKQQFTFSRLKPIFVSLETEIGSIADVLIDIICSYIPTIDIPFVPDSFFQSSTNNNNTNETNNENNSVQLNSKCRFSFIVEPDSENEIEADSFCDVCDTIITQVRWHCTQTGCHYNYNLCNTCYIAKKTSRKHKTTHSMEKITVHGIHNKKQKPVMDDFNNDDNIDDMQQNDS